MADGVNEALFMSRQVLPDVAPWCEFCNTQPSIGPNVDGQHACAGCAEQLLAANAMYEAEMAEVADLHVGPSRKQLRAARRHQRLHNDGSARQ